MGEGLLHSRDGAVLTITFDRPRRRNALDLATRAELAELLALADSDPEVRAVILTGADPAFSSGVDMTELFGDPAYVAPAVDPATQARGMLTPTIAAVNGACVTGALELMLCCTFALASERAIFADTHTKVGLLPGWAMSAHLPAAVGAGRAAQLTVTGLPIDARTALTWGLVNEVLPHEALLPRAQELAAAIVVHAPDDVRAAMRLARDGRDRQFDALRRLEHDRRGADREVREGARMSDR